MRVLSIDAWAESFGDGTEDVRSWSWNNWYKVGETETVPKTTEEFFHLMIELGYIDKKSLAKVDGYAIEDDQYNVCLVNAETREPLYAVEYGSQQ